MKKFEVPYNFYEDYIDKMSSLVDYFSYIKFVYVPCFKESNIENTRESKNYKSHQNYIKLNYIEYTNKIKEIQSLGLDVAILMQRGATFELIEKYINDLNIKYFIINDDVLAKKIKDKYGDKIYLILSITRALRFNDYLQNDLSMYDEIVLYFWFNRHLDEIKKLYEIYSYKFTLLINPNCSYICANVNEHWFEEDISKHCHCCLTPYNNIHVKPKDIIYFDKYVCTYKLVDRIMPTDYIVDEIKTYIDAYKKLNTFEFDKTIEDYYNIKD